MRSQNSLRNMIFGLSGQVISAIMGFIVRTVFIATLGVEYLGVGGLFTNILTVLSLANLGFETAIIYNLYKPLADHDHRKIQGLMRLYEKAYRYIGIVILLIGLSLLPVLNNFITSDTSIRYLHVIYILFLLNSVSTYFFAYKQSIIVADQQSHIISKIHSFFTIGSNLLQILLLLCTGNYIAVLSSQILFTVTKNIYITYKANQLYPYLQDQNKVKLTKEEKQTFFKSLYSLMLYKISGVVITGTDNIVISKFVGIVWVGIYSNYFLIIATLNTFISYIFYSITASVGNLNVQESKEKKYFIFRVINFSNFWVYGFCSVCLWSLFNPVITLWLGDPYILNKFVVFAIILEFYTFGMQNAPTMFRETTGLFQMGKYRPLFAAVINIAVSIVLAQYIGIAGVLIGTVISRLCIYFWYDPYLIFKYVFQVPVRIYFLRYIGFGALVLSVAVLCEMLGNALHTSGYTELFLRAIFCLIIPNVLFFVLFRKMEEFQYLMGIVRSFTNKYRFLRVEKKMSHL
jgi:O-antigen/teichoic acid export membrane protein